ncbi:hypothetical protein BGZ97_009493, partial [Linnemannia gamsii]
MVDHCNNSNSSSQHPSVCCVHNTENQPLLGYHPGHHASGSQYPSQAPPPAYYVDMSGNNNKGGCYTPSHAPNVHHQCYCQQHHHDHHSHSHGHQYHGEREEEDNNGYWKFIVAIVFIVFILGPAFNSSHFQLNGLSNNADASGRPTTTSSSKSGLDLLTNDSGNLNFDRCRDNAINWDGPSTFTTE